MPKARSWSEKLRANKDLPRVEEITDKMSKRCGIGTVVIPAPIEVDGMVISGKTTQPGLRARLL